MSYYFSSALQYCALVFLNIFLMVRQHAAPQTARQRQRAGKGREKEREDELEGLGERGEGGRRGNSSGRKERDPVVCSSFSQTCFSF